MTGPLVIDIAGTELCAADRRRLAHPLVGMMILFSRNYASPAQLKALCAQIHALRDPPLLISVDHEGGRVQRFRQDGFTQLPPMAAIGRLWDRDVLGACRAARATGLVLGTELRAHGVDLSFTPVVDLDWGRSAVIGDRAFHADARVVSVLAAQLNHGLALCGMSNCGKHFPAHGYAVADSHLAFSVDERSLEEVLAADAVPYVQLGVGLDSVMTAHVSFPAVDAHAVSFSRVWIQDILRGRLGFTGAVFSDDLSMKGARAAGDVLQAARACLAAGCDLVLVCNDGAGADRVLDGLEWNAGPQFAERFARLVPAPLALPREALMDQARYRQARRELEELGLGGPASAPH